MVLRREEKISFNGYIFRVRKTFLDGSVKNNKEPNIGTGRNRVRILSISAHLFHLMLCKNDAAIISTPINIAKEYVIRNILTVNDTNEGSVSKILAIYSPKIIIINSATPHQPNVIKYATLRISFVRLIFEAPYAYEAAGRKEIDNAMAYEPGKDHILITGFNAANIWEYWPIFVAPSSIYFLEKKLGILKQICEINWVNPTFIASYVSGANLFSKWLELHVVLNFPLKNIYAKTTIGMNSAVIVDKAAPFIPNFRGPMNNGSKISILMQNDDI